MIFVGCEGVGLGAGVGNFGVCACATRHVPERATIENARERRIRDFRGFDMSVGFYPDPSARPVHANRSRETRVALLHWFHR